MKRDPIINKAATSAGSPRNTSAKTVKSISGGPPNYSGGNASTSRSPTPNSPYGKR